MEQTELLEAIKSIASEGADLTAIETGLTAFGVKPIDSVLDRETALDFIKNNAHLQSALDSRISSGVDTYKKRFNDEELPALKSSLTQELLKELNPEMTEVQKLEQVVEQMKKETLEKEKKTLLRGELQKTYDTLKAGDMGFKVEDLALYAEMGDSGIENFAKMHTRFSEILKIKFFGLSPTFISFNLASGIQFLNGNKLRLAKSLNS